MARRVVMNESGKCRSGRSSVREGLVRFSGRGGKSAGVLRADEGVAAQNSRDVMVPATKAPPLEVVEAQFAFEVLVDALGAPALLDDPNQTLVAHLRWHGREVELGGLG